MVSSCDAGEAEVDILDCAEKKQCTASGLGYMRVYKFSPLLANRLWIHDVV
jgi:hypothetical protein